MPHHHASTQQPSGSRASPLLSPQNASPRMNLGNHDHSTLTDRSHLNAIMEVTGRSVRPTECGSEFTYGKTSQSCLQQSSLTKDNYTDLEEMMDDHQLSSMR